MTSAPLLVFGASGMLGFALHRTLHDTGHSVYGVVRSQSFTSHPWCSGLNHLPCPDISNTASLREFVLSVGPGIVINAAGLKKAADQQAQLEMFRVNSLFPHVLGRICEEADARLIHFSSDGVFSGERAPYLEDSVPDAGDYYGQTKGAGEPCGPRALTIRCSMIGRNAIGSDSLADWVLGSNGPIRGYSKSVFNGIPVNEIAAFLDHCVLPRISQLHGLLHLHGASISKLELIRGLAAAWGKQDLVVVPDDSVELDRSLRSHRLAPELGYVAPEWRTMLSRMHKFYEDLGNRDAG